MAEIKHIHADLHKPYSTILKYFMLTGINLFDDKNAFISKFNNLHIFLLMFYIVVSSCHWRYLVWKFSVGFDFLDIAIDLSYCYNSVQGIILYLYMCVIKRGVKDFVVDLEKQWRDDISLKPLVALLKHNEIKKFDFIIFSMCLSIEIFLHFYMSSPLVIILVKKYLFNEEVVYNTPLQFFTPFEYKDNILKFIFIYLVDYLAITILTRILNGSLIILTVSIKLLHILYVLLQEDFKEVIESRKDINIKLKQTIQRYTRLNRLVKKVGNAFGILFAIHVFCIATTACFYSVAAKINGRPEDFKNLIISLLTSLNVFYCCIQGQLLNDAAQDIANVIYESSWEDLSNANKQMILLTILRSQQTSYVQSTSFVEVSLNTFIAIMKMTWSLISLISTMYD